MFGAIERGSHVAALLLIFACSATALWLAGCSGGVSLPTMPELPEMPSFAALAAETPPDKEASDGNAKPKPEPKPVEIAELMKPGTLGDRSIGKASAPVNIIEYASMTCPVCSRFQAETLPKLKKAYIDKGKVRLIFREFPIGHTAAAAALAIRCVAEKDYFNVVDKYYATQKDWVAQEIKKDEIYKVVQSTGLKRDKFDACLADQHVNDALVWVKQRGREFGVAGTPTFFINGKKVAGGVSFEEMQGVIEAALATPPPAAAPVQAQQPVPAAKPQQQAAAKAS